AWSPCIPAFSRQASNPPVFSGWLFSLIEENKRKIGWDGISKAARDSQNKFSKLSISKLISTHENEWVKRIRDFRAEIIHYNLLTGNDKAQISYNHGELKFELLYSVPKKLMKKLKLESLVHKDIGVDLQFGSIEIAERSIVWLTELTSMITTEFTSNEVQLIE
ncbi:hypothetical protein, partial [Candidatus Albibeggiatoa sp. nov. BB20]|uniref:hypothetical protein n=1 Tax=Candidatus Albibeggiatoa sp. nov. BB20 TaxID=3162723 RepID=UPI00336530D4